MSEKWQLGLLIKFIHNAVEKDCNCMLREMDITATQRDILMYLLHHRDREVNQRDIERDFQVQNPTVTGILQRMENKGLIRRVTSENDGRYKRIMVTDRSIEMEKKILKKGEEIEQRVTQGLSKEEQEQMRELLMRILHNVI